MLLAFLLAMLVRGARGSIWIVNPLTPREWPATMRGGTMAKTCDLKHQRKQQKTK
jgi:hypothetical protein